MSLIANVLQDGQDQHHGRPRSTAPRAAPTAFSTSGLQPPAPRVSAPIRRSSWPPPGRPASKAPSRLRPANGRSFSWLARPSRPKSISAWLMAPTSGRARFNVSLPGVEREVAQAVLDGAHQMCAILQSNTRQYRCPNQPCLSLTQALPRPGKAIGICSPQPSASPPQPQSLACSRSPRRDRRHDRRQLPVRPRLPGERGDAHRQRGPRHQPRGVRRDKQAARDDRVGVRIFPLSESRVRSYSMVWCRSAGSLEVSRV